MTVRPSRPGVRGGGYSLPFLLRSERGAAAAEFALIVMIMTVPLANIIDIAVYTFRKVQVELAAEAGVQAIRGMCGPEQAPVTEYCTDGLMDQVTTAMQSTSLGSGVTLQEGSLLEGYYCVNSSTMELELVGSTGTIGAPPERPASFNCEGSGSASATPGDYVQVTASYTYTPLFANLTAASLLPSPVLRTAWYRVR